MPTATAARRELFNQVEVGLILKLNRKTVGELAPVLGLAWKADPNRSGIPRLLDRDDVIRLAEKLGIDPDWGAIPSA